MPTPKLSSSSSDNVDKWIEQLMQAKQLTENEVKLLCDKVLFNLTQS